MFKRKILITFIASSITLGGCTTLKEKERIEQMPTSLKTIDEITENIRNTQKKESNRFYMHYEIDAESSDFDEDFLNQEPIVDVDINSSASFALDFITEKLGYSIVYDLKHNDSLDKIIRIKANSMRPIDLINYIERVADLDVYKDKTTLIISDTMTINGSFSKLENIDSGSVFESLKANLATIINVENQYTTEEPVVVKQIEGDTLEGEDTISSLNNENPLSLPSSNGGSLSQVVVDKGTGAFYLRSTPERIRQSKDMIESMINTAVSHASVEMQIYRINNSRAKEIGLSVSKIIDNLYTLSAGSSATPLKTTLDYQRDSTDTNGDILKVGLSMYERNGIINSESKTTLTVFNDVLTQMSDLQDVGNWVPGELTQDSTVINGASVITYSEAKPEFELQKVGNALEFTPRIDIDNQVINMAIKYTNSSIYKLDTFSWERIVGTGQPIVIQKPLKTENIISATVVVNKDKYTILAGMKSKKGEISREFIPGMGDIPLAQSIGGTGSNMDNTDSLIVVKANFPDTAINKVLTKTKIIN